MKQLFLIFAILVQSCGLLSADAKLAVSSKSTITKEAAVSGSVSLTDDDLALSVRLSKNARTSFKIGLPRSFASTADLASNFNPLAAAAFSKISKYRSPFYLPLVRLLLFPKHYFW